MATLLCQNIPALFRTQGPRYAEDQPPPPQKGVLWGLMGLTFALTMHIFRLCGGELGRALIQKINKDGEAESAVAAKHVDSPPRLVVWRRDTFRPCVGGALSHPQIIQDGVADKHVVSLPILFAVRHWKHTNWPQATGCFSLLTYLNWFGLLNVLCRRWSQQIRIAKSWWQFLGSNFTKMKPISE
jgi:hypothetical protein